MMKRVGERKRGRERECVSERERKKIENEREKGEKAKRASKFHVTTATRQCEKRLLSK